MYKLWTHVAAEFDFAAQRDGFFDGGRIIVDGHSVVQRSVEDAALQRIAEARQQLLVGFFQTFQYFIVYLRTVIASRID